MKVKFKKITNINNDLNELLSAIEKEWLQIGGEPGINEFYYKKISKVNKKKEKTELLYDNNKVVGFYLSEMSSQHYGVVTIYCKQKKYIKPLSERIIENGIFINAQIEISTITFKEEFKSTFQEHDLIINQRHRMSLQLDSLTPFNIAKDEYDYFLMDNQYSNITGAISYEAHLISKDYKHYPDMNTLEKRIQLEKDVFNKRSGEVNKNASIMICKNTTIIGYCLVVNCKDCWGHKVVPWIFDIAIHPNYMGQKLGKKILQASINSLINQKFPIMGLSVTENNFNAIRLYESVGFYIIDDFYEFIKPVQL